MTKVFSEHNVRPKNHNNNITVLIYIEMNKMIDHFFTLRQSQYHKQYGHTEILLVSCKHNEENLHAISSFEAVPNAFMTVQL